MKKDTAYYTKLIAKYLAGEATRQEVMLLAEWIREDEENRKLFEVQGRVWSAVTENALTEQMDVNTEWDTFIAGVVGRKGKFSTERRKKRRLVPMVSRIAAAVLVLVVSFVAINFFIKRSATEVLTAKNDNIEVALPDGSDITLHKGSELKYDTKFNKGRRQVNLKGEAYFMVKRDTVRTFVIAVNDVMVEVLGTSFLVNGSSEEGDVEVMVTSGKVVVYFNTNPDERVMLISGEKVVTSGETRTLTKTAITDKNYIAWKTKKITFNDETLDNVIKTLSHIYNTEIVINTEKLNNRRLTATFDNQSLHSVLNVIEATLQVKVIRNRESIQITEDGSN